MYNIRMNKKEEHLLKKIDEVAKAFEDLTGNNDAFNYNRLGEVQTAILLGLKWNAGFDSKDATDLEGNPIELKSTTQARIQGTYNGLTAKETEDEFIEYMERKYPSNTRHIFVRKDNGTIAEAWEVNNEIVLDIVIGKVLKNWYTDGLYDTKGRGDPRPGANVCMTEIKKHGEKIELHR